MAGGVAVEEGTFALDELIKQNVEALITVGVLAHTSAMVCDEEDMPKESVVSLMAFRWAAGMLMNICDLTEEEMEMRFDARMEELGIAPPTTPDA